MTSVNQDRYKFMGVSYYSYEGSVHEASFNRQSFIEAKRIFPDALAVLECCACEGKRKKMQEVERSIEPIRSGPCYHSTQHTRNHIVTHQKLRSGFDQSPRSSQSASSNLLPVRDQFSPSYPME